MAGLAKAERRCLLLQATQFAEWRAALWSVLHGTHRSRPSPQGKCSSVFREDVFVFTWLRLQKATDKLLATASESIGQLGNAAELQRLQGIGNQVRLTGCPCLARRSDALHLTESLALGLTGKLLPFAKRPMQLGVWASCSLLVIWKLCGIGVL